MLQPKKPKFRKQFKGRMHGVSKGGNFLNFGADISAVNSCSCFVRIISIQLLNSLSSLSIVISLL